MKNVAVPVVLLQQSLTTLKKQASERDTAMEKLASVESDLRVAHSILEMVQDGLIDPTDSMTKFAEFSDKPELIELTKQAAKMGYTNTSSLGELVADSTLSNSDVTPESRLKSRLESF